MEEVKKEVLETLQKIKNIEEHLEERSPREIREDVRADRSDALANRMDEICDRLTDKLEGIVTTLTKVDTRLNNHLSHHETLEKYLMYPLALALLCGAGAILWGIIKVHI